MPSVTRAAVAAQAKERLDKLAEDLTTAAVGDRTEGDFTYPIDDALRDCGFDAIAGADTHAKIRAVLRGAEYYALARLWNRRAVLVSSTQGAGYASGQQAVQWNDPQKTLLVRLKDAREEYTGALAAIGRRLNADGASAAGVLEIDAASDVSGELVDSAVDVGLPWFQEGYHEVGD